MAKLAALIAEVTQLEYAFAVRARLSNLEQALFLSQMVDWWTGALPQFGPIPRQITEASKKAYEHLIVTDFELRFGNEYLALAEKKIEDFGVALASKGVDGTVTLAPTIGGKPIESILSEGELRLHALALFFAEVETSGHSVVVFDDPVSSFDFNYITNFCERLRELASSHPAKQILVLTHNWEFFVQVQLTMNQGGLDGQLAVFVLEGCQLVRSYSEELRDLKDQIDSILTLQREPTASEKCDLAGLMRRLIEAVVNEHVFVNQRSNFKQKTQQMSAFDKFTKVKPLLPAEVSVR